jgi:hypothetical protein
MSNILNILSEETFADKMDTTNALLAAIASGDGGIKFTSFRDLQRLTRLGLASKVLAVGDQIVCERATATTATVGNSEGNHGITAAAVDRDIFLHAIGTSHNGNFEFFWDGAVWHYGNEAVELSTYGITVTGTPALGDEIVVHETAVSLVWDVIGIDCDTPADAQFEHSVTLGLHDCFVELQFDPREALFYFEEGLAAGTYNFTVKAHSWVSGDVNKTFQFTLTQAIPAKGQLVLQVAYNVTIAGSTAKTYSSSTSTTEIETVTITEGSGGTSLGDVNNAISGGTNSLQRGLLGNNRYSQSAMRQYLNSNAAAGSVWTPKNVWDRAPSWATTTAGFLNGMDEDFLSVIGEVTKRTALNTVSDGGGYEDTIEKFFLLSRSEVYGGNEVTGGEGAAYPYYSDYSDLGSAGTGNDSNRIKYRSGPAQYWWLRSPNAGSADYVRIVYSAGGVSGSVAHNSYGVAPACCII